MQRGAVTGEVTFPVPAERLVEMMFGKLVTIDDRPPVAPGAPVVEVAGLSARSGRQTISEVAFELREGEVLGLAGLEGSGQLPLLRALAGLDKPTAGIVRLAGEDLAHRSHRHHLRRGVYFLPAGRLEEGLFRGLTISEHLALDDGGGAGDSESDVLRAVEAIDRLRIKGTPDTVVEDLSGGNQQRLLLAMLPERLRLLLMEQPTRGLDIESADLIWSRILLRRNEGTAIVFASADLDELVRYSDRLAVCFDGGVLAMEDAAGLSADRLGTLMGGRYR
jgi:simple sugar transport system ATP-binding protein